ncbi:hypothetical protein ASG35_09130 [Burkholderia sp. Leaf177]|nr:hypothetical protein ASG35_09130 [Burkholderia sp. Leaf177]
MDDTYGRIMWTDHMDELMRCVPVRGVAIDEGRLTHCQMQDTCHFVCIKRGFVQTIAAIERLRYGV